MKENLETDKFTMGAKLSSNSEAMKINEGINSTEPQSAGHYMFTPLLGGGSKTLSNIVEDQAYVFTLESNINSNMISITESPGPDINTASQTAFLMPSPSDTSNSSDDKALRGNILNFRVVTPHGSTPSDSTRRLSGGGTKGTNNSNVRFTPGPHNVSSTGSDLKSPHYFKYGLNLNDQFGNGEVNDFKGVDIFSINNPPTPDIVKQVGLAALTSPSPTLINTAPIWETNGKNYGAKDSSSSARTDKSLVDGDIKSKAGGNIKSNYNNTFSFAAKEFIPASYRTSAPTKPTESSGAYFREGGAPTSSASGTWGPTLEATSFRHSFAPTPVTSTDPFVPIVANMFSTSNSVFGGAAAPPASSISGMWGNTPDTSYIPKDINLSNITSSLAANQSRQHSEVTVGKRLHDEYTHTNSKSIDHSSRIEFPHNTTSSNTISNNIITKNDADSKILNKGHTEKDILDSSSANRLLESKKRSDLVESPATKLKFKDFHRQLKLKEKEGFDATKDFSQRCIDLLPEKVHYKIYLELADLAKRENRFNEARALYRLVNTNQPYAFQGISNLIIFLLDHVLISYIIVNSGAQGGLNIAKWRKSVENY